HGGAGPLDALNMGFRVDLANGSVSDGNFEARAGEQQWTFGFSGSIDGAKANMHSFTNTLITNGDGIQSDAIHGTLEGVFTGSPSEPGFVTGFSLQGGDGSGLQGMGLLKGAAQ